MMQKFMRLTPSLEAEFLFHHGVHQIKAEKYESAIASFDRALRCKPDYSEALSQRGFALGSLGRHTEAIASFDKALTIRPGACWLWHNRGIALREVRTLRRCYQ